MIFRFAVSASDLPDLSSGAYASLSYGSHQFGQSEVIKGSTEPSWKKIFILDLNNVEKKEVTVAIVSKKNGKEMGRAQISATAIMERKSAVFHEDLPGGGTIHVLTAEHRMNQAALAKLQIHGKDVVNKSRGQSLGGKANPSYELRSAQGDLILHRSETKVQTSNPCWSAAEISLWDLCRGDPDAPFEFAFFHYHPVTSKRTLIGSLKATVNDLLIASAHDTSIPMRKDGERTGKILVVQAECVGFTDSSVLAAVKEARKVSKVTALAADTKSQAAELAREEFDKACQDAEARRKSELLAETALFEAKKSAEQAKAVSQEAAEVAKKIKEAGPMGTLKFQFVGKKLKNVESFTWIDKSDPFFVLQKVASEKDGQINWSHVYVSHVVMNNLDPIWAECNIKVNDICRGDLDEPIRVVVFDWERNGQHRLIGSFETTINGIISAQRSSVEVPLTNGNEVTGFIFVPYAEVVGLVDSTVAEKRAAELAEKAENACFFAKGVESRLEVAGKAAKRAQTAAIKTKQMFEAATAEADAARRRVMELKKVRRTLGEFG